MKRTMMAGLSVALLLAACSDDGSSSTDTNVAVGSVTIAVDDTAPPVEDTIPFEADATLTAAVQGAVDSAARGCDPLDTRSCLLPFPSNLYTQQDPSSDTTCTVTATGQPARQRERARPSMSTNGTVTTASAQTRRSVPGSPTSIPRPRSCRRGPTSAPRSPTMRPSCCWTSTPANAFPSGPNWTPIPTDHVDQLPPGDLAAGGPQQPGDRAIRGLVDTSGATIEATPHLPDLPRQPHHRHRGDRVPPR